MRTLLVAGLAILLSATALADVITATSGNKIECVVLQENRDTVVVRRGYGTMTYPRSSIASIAKSPVVSESEVPPTTRPIAGQRMPSWNEVLAKLVKSKWATDVQQIPATYVDVGVMRNVPYKSYRCGTDYEVNIYGDPEHPASVEIGVYRTLLNSAEAKRNCIEFMSLILGDKTDAAIVKALNQAKDLVVRDEWTTEITPATAPDAYGAWWISFYNEKELDGARASEEELKQITVAKNTPAPPAQKADLVPARSGGRQAVAAVQPVAAPLTEDDWSLAELLRARVSSAVASSSASKTVYVRGYYRKNGTYVHSYTRSSRR